MEIIITGPVEAVVVLIMVLELTGLMEASVVAVVEQAMNKMVLVEALL
tara:strand:+ start:649 stop:792 length:144 start_codon:yes stop_codon:yes gene_type:complete